MFLSWPKYMNGSQHYIKVAKTSNLVVSVVTSVNLCI